MAAAVSSTFDDDQDRGLAGGREVHPPTAEASPALPAPSMGDAVTPHALITGPIDWRFLLAGIDTLDLGVYVDWGVAWYELQPQLEYHRQCTLNGDKNVWRHDLVGEAIVRGSSKRNYRYHVQTHDLNIWLADAESPKDYPNVYASPSARSLWTDGPAVVVEGLRHLLLELGGQVMEIQVSRCDLAADFALPEGLSLDFLRHHRVSRTRKTHLYEENEKLETYYVAKPGAPIQARIYDKLTAIMAKPGGEFFFPLWGGPAPTWRVEFQLKRSFLREAGINSMDDLVAQTGGLWTYLTDQWLSLRLQDNQNTRRRTVHPWWQAVQDCADLFGPSCTISRGNDTPPLLSPDWYVSHMSGCLVSLAARLGTSNISEAIKAFEEHARTYWAGKSWNEAYGCKRVECQLPADTEGGDDVPF